MVTATSLKKKKCIFAHLKRRLGRLRRMAVAMAAAMTMFGAFAENVYRSEPVVAHWTGAVSSYWRDPGNWRIEGIESHPEWEGQVIPGVFTNASYVTKYGNMGHKADQAVFDTYTTTTNVWLNDMVAISNVTFRGALLPRFRFSSGTLQMIDGSVLKVEEDVPLAPVLDCRLALGTYATRAGTVFTLWNDSPTELKVNSVWGNVYNDPDGGYSGRGIGTFIVAGQGDVRFNYNIGVGYRNGYYFESRQSGDGKIIFSSAWAPNPQKIVVNRPDLSLQRFYLSLTEYVQYQDLTKFSGGLGFRAWGLGVDVKKGNTLLIEGEDAFCFKTYAFNGEMDRISVAEGAYLQIDSEVSCQDGDGKGTPTHGLAPAKTSAGTIRLTNAKNSFAGEPDLQGGVWETDVMGTPGEAGPLGTAERFLCSGSGTLRYVGKGETTTRGIRCTTENGIVLDNAGSGDLVFDSDVICEYASGTTTLAVSNSSDHRIVFKKPIASGSDDVRVVVLAGTLGLTGANAYTGGTCVDAGQTLELHGSGALASAVELSDGSTVRIVGDADVAVARSLPVTVKSGDGYLYVTGKAEVTLTSLTLASGAALRIYTDDPATKVSVSGKTSADAVPDGVSVNGCVLEAFGDDGALVCENTISGDVDVSYSGAYRYALSGSCTYTGKTILDGTLGGAIYATLPGSIPNYDKVEATGGDVIVPVTAPDGSAAWSDADILALANAGSFAQGAVVSVDTTASGDHTITLSDAAITGSTFGLGASGTNTLTVTGTATKEINFAARGGTLEFRDADVTLGTGLVTTDIAGGGSAGTVVFDHTTARLASSEDMISVGGYWAKNSSLTSAQRGDLVGKVVIRDSTVTCAATSAPNLATLNFAVGGNQTAGRGLMEISGESTVVTAQFCVASVAYGDGAAVHQYGGSVVNRLGAKQWGNEGRPYMAYMGNGEWNLYDGSYTSVGSVLWAANQSPLDALFMQYGGTSRFEPNGSGNLFIMGSGYGTSASSLNGGRSHLYVAGGSCLITNMTIQVPNLYNFGYAELIVDGPSSKLSLVDVPVRLGTTKGTRVCFTVSNGGLFEFSNSIYNFSASAPSEIFINVNGGRIRLIKNNGTKLGLAEEGRKEGRITVFEKGVEFDITDGRGLEVNFPIVRPVGKGVKSIVLKDGVGDYMDPVGAPGLFVKDGGGDGATALAQFDPATRSVTNVIVTCPGWGYTSAPNVSVRYSCSTTERYLEKVELVDLVGGGLTKVGPGSLTLCSTNSYAGATVVKEGTLLAGRDGAIPEGNALELAGGDLDLAGHSATIGSVTLKGSGRVLNAGAAVWPGDWAVDVSEKPGYEFAEAVAFPSGATLTIVHPETIANRGSITLFTMKGGYSGELPALAGMGEKWQLRVSGNRLRLSQPHGAMLIVR